jgi:ComEC/Rec2-related protein
VSGTNVTFVVSFLMEVLIFFLPRRKVTPFAILGIILYLFVVGFDAPLVRVAIITFLTFWMVEGVRLTSAWRVLLLTAGLMLIIVPDWITDIGFIPSFVSTASIMLFDKNRKLSETSF